MSTYWGYVCVEHHPPLHSEHWFNHGEEALARFVTAFRAGQYTVEDELPTIDYSPGYPTREPARWLLDHPNCTIALGNEYGDIRPMRTP